LLVLVSFVQVAFAWPNAKGTERADRGVWLYLRRALPRSFRVVGFEGFCAAASNMDQIYARSSASLGGT